MNINVYDLCVHLFIQDTHVKMHMCGKLGLQRALTRAIDTHGCSAPCCVVSTAQGRHLDGIQGTSIGQIFGFHLPLSLFEGENSCLELITKMMEQIPPQKP